MPKKTPGMPGYYGSTELREKSIIVSMWGIALYAFGIGLMMSALVLTTIMFPEKFGDFFAYFATDTALVVSGMLLSCSGLLTILGDRFVAGLFLKRNPNGVNP